MKKTISILMLAAVTAAVVIGSVRAAEPAAPAAGPQIGIMNYKFDPATLTVPAGTTVTWANHDEVPHTVASSDKRFTSSGALDTGDSYSYKFTTPGTYGYYCTLHPFMTGKIVVTDAPSGN
ncbi:MAG TPA: cupredoxin family copper-binding protein [Gammaproteobacteria bacterium]|nr:cupredoxin family copper-binding protein [Gammaproteobacteria bacterium]